MLLNVVEDSLETLSLIIYFQALEVVVEFCVQIDFSFNVVTNASKTVQVEPQVALLCFGQNSLGPEVSPVLVVHAFFPLL